MYQIFETLMTTSQEDLNKIRKKLENENPGPLHAMLREKQPRREAIELFESRKRKVTKDVPPTCTGKSGDMLGKSVHERYPISLLLSCTNQYR